MTVAGLCRVGLVLFACAGAGCAGRAQSLSPVRDLPPGAIPNDPVPGERYYMLVFGSERTLRVPRYTHTWATVVRTVEAPGCAPEVAEVHTISWMPATLVIHPWQFKPEPGRNLGLHETVRMALGHREHVALWGPYEIHPRGYRRFLMQKAFMESGRVGYQCVDTVGEGADGTGCDCIHAVTDMDPQFERNYYRLTRFGQAGSEFIVRQLFERDLLVTEETHSRLLGPLGLCCYPIDHRVYRDRPHLLGGRQRGAGAIHPCDERCLTPRAHEPQPASPSVRADGDRLSGSGARSHFRPATFVPRGFKRVTARRPVPGPQPAGQAGRGPGGRHQVGPGGEDHPVAADDERAAEGGELLDGLLEGRAQHVAPGLGGPGTG